MYTYKNQIYVFKIWIGWMLLYVYLLIYLLIYFSFLGNDASRLVITPYTEKIPRRKTYNNKYTVRFQAYEKWYSKTTCTDMFEFLFVYIEFHT